MVHDEVSGIQVPQPDLKLNSGDIPNNVDPGFKQEPVC